MQKRVIRINFILSDFFIKFFYKKFIVIFDFLLICFLIKNLNLMSCELINCMPLEPFMQKDTINDRTYFYTGDVDKIIVENDLSLLLDNFNSLEYQWVNYLDQNFKKFNFRNPNDHYNLSLNLQFEFLNYYCSFPFTHNNNGFEYHEYLSNININDVVRKQYWRPYITVNDKNFVKINKFSLNPNNYLVSNNLQFKIYEVLKLYTKK